MGRHLRFLLFDWPHLAEPVAESVTSLKKRHDELHVIGSLNLVQRLLPFGLVDRLNLWRYPLLLGTGKKVFDDGTLPTALRLSESVTYTNGTLHLVFGDRRCADTWQSGHTRAGP